MNIDKIVSLESKSWLKWTLATAIGFFVSDYLSFIVGSQASTQIFALLDILFAGLIIGTLQWLFVLRSHVQKSEQWIWFTTVGWAIGWVSGNLFGSMLFLALFVHGAVLGSVQWFFIIRKSYPTSLSWIFTSSFGLPLAYILSWNIIFPILSGLGYDGTLSGPADSIVRGVLFGAITGVSLIRLKSPSEKSKENALPKVR